MTEHDVDFLIVRSAGKFRHDLFGKANADAQNVRRQRGEQTIVKSAPASEAAAVGGEGKSGNEDDFRADGIGDRALGGVRFEDAEGARY